MAYVNELDTFALRHGLDTRQIITGVGLDPRIGLFYNNPSFGYGRYCLPKDTQQLLANYRDVPQHLDPSRRRVEHHAQGLRRPGHSEASTRGRRHPPPGDESGFGQLPHFVHPGREKRLKAKGVEVILYEPLLTEDSFFHSEVVRDLDEFKRRPDVIVANRRTPDIADVADKVYTRDLFGSD